MEITIKLWWITAIVVCMLVAGFAFGGIFWSNFYDRRMRRILEELDDLYNSDKKD